LLKIIIDTNIFISGILTEGGNPSLVIKAWKRSQKYKLFVTEEIIQEILKVLKRLKVTEDIIYDWDQAIRKNAIKVITTQKIDFIKDDPEDNKFLECAISAHADYIVSGDSHLTKLKKFEGVNIVTAKQFLEILSNYKEK
jgi:putative PIN family toxin of toxin-antitoxin system